MNCPHCSAPIADAPDLSGQLVQCAKCGGQLMMPGAPHVQQTRYRPAFRPRQYPAMRAISIIFYVLTALVILNFILLEALLILSQGSTPDQRFGHAELAVASLVNLLFHGMQAVTFMFAAELIKIIVDIQSNTQEAAFRLRQM